ncbi:hypothetical protein [Desulfoluna sp.]|uniref:IS1096 element passenger TnpR family protein n=1 Tax=Desulfoluna sp. TaxID=2045199 RepID=UPI00263A02BD|nr:hypothetical protein [Desulfoluna sp.]
MNERLYLSKIQMLDIEPVIWRRFVVPASITLDRLHDVIQGPGSRLDIGQIPYTLLS